MDAAEFSIWIFLLSVFAGYLLGVISGLIPGIHTNNFALVLLAFSSFLSEQGLPLICIAAIILANSLSHTFHDIIPSIFLGAPGADMALAVLPGHNLLLEGKGAEAIRLSALGSAGSVALALITAYPLSIIFSTMYPYIQEYIAWILIIVVLVMVFTEKGEYGVPGLLQRLKYPFNAFLVFMVCGLLGVFAFNKEDLMNPFLSLGEPSILLPLLSGLFGSSQLIISLMSNPVIPFQFDSRMELDRKRIARGIVVGGTSGSLVAWLPGISSSIATVFARLFVKEDFETEAYKDLDNSVNNESVTESAKEFIVSISGVNTCNAIFGLLALAVIGKSRSGAMVAINELLGSIELNASFVILFLFAISLTAILSYYSTVFLGDNIHRLLYGFDYSVLCYAVLALLFLMCFVFTGTFGLMIFLIATPIGMLPSFMGIRKSHAMGVIILPVILYFI
ncbi:tripartite tricarboxylate transporter permease [Methanolobus bombayensis]|uniref:tripartite tricarboxylate transporter permease n=1 Tax=Methanolobus bombayensis TaxID=38023 RepID=UPI001AE9DB6A|nr:tripartite tricarboxylate transporter permease [Methanolobus bombayensis]MBP1909132.1 putative membrane protein [Methanolobus bombayensis]